MRECELYDGQVLKFLLSGFEAVLHTAVSKKVVQRKRKSVRDNAERQSGKHQGFNKSSRRTMPRPYSEDLRWRAIWMKEFLRFSVDEVAAALYISPKTILRYVSKCLKSGEVKAETLRRPLNSFLMHPHVEFVIMEAVLDHPEKTLSEIAQNIYEQTGSDRALSSILLYLKRNRFSRKKVCQCHVLIYPCLCKFEKQHV